MIAMGGGIPRMFVPVQAQISDLICFFFHLLSRIIDNDRTQPKYNLRVNGVCK